MDHTEKSPTVLSLCTGYGGIEIGLERAIGRINVLAHVEIEAYAIANLVAKMETGQMVPAPVWTNLKTFRPKVFRNRVDILTGGYPCQPFSAAGQRRGHKDPRHIWPWIRSAIKVIRPAVCFFENVEGHISLGLREVLTDLVKIGYRVENDSGEPTWGLFSAAEVGAPHQRKRVFILAYSERSRAREFMAYGPNRYGKDQQAWEKGPISTSGSSEKKLGNPQGHDQRRRTVPAMHREGVQTRGSGINVADSRGAEFNRVSESEERQQDCSVGVAGVGLANTCKQGPQGRGKLGGQKAERETSEVIRYDLARCHPQYWPARPGQAQYSWEEPRVLADTTSQGHREGRYQKAGSPRNKARLPESKRQGKRQAQPQLGRAIDGNTHRVDRLRLLGNGVVPATAEKAFVTLMSRVLKPNRDRLPIEIQLELFA